MLKPIALLLAGLFVAACGSSDDTGRAALAAVEGGALLIDVRSAAEFAGGHLPGALNIPHGDIVPGVSALGVDPSADIILYCRSGNRSGIAAASLTRAGFSSVVNAGGYADLKPVWDSDR